MTVIKKWAWVATEAKGGWRLKLNAGGRYFKLKGLLVKSTLLVEEMLPAGKVTFVHLKNTKYAVK